MRYLSLAFLVPALAHAADAPSFARDVAPLLAERCAGCHSTSAKLGGLDVESFDALMKGGKHGPAIVPGKSAESRLFQMISGQGKPPMPMDGTKLADAQIAAIQHWIDAGAPAPAPGEALPKSAGAAPKIAPKVPLKPQIFDLAYSPDGKLIALAGFKTVRLLDAATRQPLGELTGHVETVRSVAFSHDGTLLAAAGGLPARKGEVRIWDVSTRKLVQTIQGHADCVYAVAFAPDGKSIATTSYDKLVKTWDVQSGKEIRTYKDHIDAVYALAFTPDGKRLVTGAADRTVKIWDVATGTRLYTLSDAQDGINTLAVDPAGRYVAAGGLDNTIRVWELEEKSGKLIASLIAHEDAILRIAWSPDGKVLASSSADRTIKLLQSGDLTEISSFTAQPDWVYGLQFAPDGKTVAAGRIDGSLAFYNNSSSNLQRASR